MTNRERNLIEKKSNTVKPAEKTHEKKHHGARLPAFLQKLSNRSIQRLMLQRKGEEAYQLDDETAGRINHERGGGASLDSKLQMQMSNQLGFDLSGVRVHTSSSSDQLNQELNAKAFTTGQDVFFKSGAYNPQSSGGQELIAHELTHVVQQGTGQVQNQGGMTVNAPGDQYEQEADGVAKNLGSAAVPAVQAQEEEELQMQEEEEEVQMNGEEEEELQMQEEDELQMQEEEELQMQEEEEEMQLKAEESAIQRVAE